MEKVCDLQTHGLKFIQDDGFFPFGTDGVELANFAEGGARDRAIDLGCGTGIVPVLLAGKKGIPTVGVELQPDVAALARRNAELNDLPVTIVNARVQDVRSLFPAGSFTVVTCNPPYRKAGSGSGSLSERVRIARHQVAMTLTDALDAASYLLGQGGRFYIVHITERMDEVMCEAYARRLTPKALQVLRPAGKKPHIFLLKCVKDGKRGLEVYPERDVLGSTGVDYPE